MTMKKAILLAVFSLFIISAPVYAQVVPDPTPAPLTADELRAELTTLLTQLIAQLQAQITDLLNQAQVQSTQQAALNTKVDQLIQNTTPVSIPLGSTAPQIVTPIVNNTPVPTTLVVNEDGDRTGISLPDFPHGEIFFKASVLDQFGKNIKNLEVKMQDPVDDVKISLPSDFDSMTLAQTGNIGDWYTSFSYRPGTSGTHTITFTSGNLSTTTTLITQ